MSKYISNAVFADRYLLLQKLGVGGFSEVWKAVDAETGVTIAIKIYSPEKGLDNDGIKVFTEEFKAVFNIKHPHILSISYYGKHEGSPFLVMPFCERGSAVELIGKLDEHELARLINHISSALEFLHGKEEPLIHHDIKPDNFLVDSYGNYLLTDFGISTKIRRTLSRNAGLTDYGGTLPYLPPERYGRDRKIVPAGDIFSFGVSLFELATVDLPFGEMGGLLVNKGVETPILTGEFSERFKKIVYSCMEADPDIRPDASQLRQISEFYLSNGYWDELDIKEKVPVTSLDVEKDFVKPATERQTHRKVSYESGGETSEEILPLKTKKEGSKKRNNVVIFALSAVIGLVILGGGYYYLNNTKQGNLLEQYNAKIQEGNRYFDASDFKSAIATYEAAATIKPDEQSAHDKLKMCKDTIEYGFNKYYLQGNTYKTVKDYENARISYQLALKYKPSNQEVMNCMKEIDEEMNKSYNESLAESRRLVKQRKYIDAIEDATKAKAIKPDGTEPQKLIDSISSLIGDNYTIAMASGNKYFQENNYNLALQYFQDALKYKPGDPFTQKKINDVRIAQNDIEDSYNLAIQQANSLYNQDRFSEALKKYKEALQFKEGDDIASRRIDEITNIYRLYNYPKASYVETTGSEVVSVEIVQNKYTKVKVRITHNNDAEISIYDPKTYPDYAFILQANGIDYIVKRCDTPGFVLDYHSDLNPFEIVLVFEAIPINVDKINLIEGKKQLENYQSWTFKDVKLVAN
ncbi:MAG: protein kinase [Bacteroidia bacterium]|nr:protein kinase [Bacteroidia bacterium]